MIIGRNVYPVHRRIRTRYKIVNRRAATAIKFFILMRKVAH